MDLGLIRCRTELEVAYWLRDYGLEDPGVVEAVAAQVLERVERDCALGYPLDWAVRFWAPVAVRAWMEEAE